VDAPPALRGTAVLRDYPLRLWVLHREHSEALLREFQLLLIGTADELARRLVGVVGLADVFTRRFGPLIDAINAERQAALDRGLDRFDSRVPMPEGTPELLDRVQQVLAAVDEYCAAGDLLVLPRTPELVALARWTDEELRRQYAGGPATPWPGPF
jgi:hypothetical protein